MYNFSFISLLIAVSVVNATWFKNTPHDSITITASSEVAIPTMTKTNVQTRLSTVTESTTATAIQTAVEMQTVTATQNVFIPTTIAMPPRVVTNVVTHTHTDVITRVNVLQSDPTPTMYHLSALETPHLIPADHTLVDRIVVDVVKSDSRLVHSHLSNFRSNSTHIDEIFQNDASTMMMQTALLVFTLCMVLV